MRITALLILFLSIAFGSFQRSYAQDIDQFENEFEVLSRYDFDSLGVSKLLEKYFPILIPFNQVNQLAMNMRGEKLDRFPLERMRDKKSYRLNIDKLINSKSPQMRLLGYLMVVSAGDKSKVNLLIHNFKMETASNNSMWLGMGLMYMGYSDTTALFKWVAKKNVDAGGFLLPLFINLPKDSLRNTAYQFASSPDWNERIYAIQVLMEIGYSFRSDSTVRNAIKNWPFHLKGYAIVPAQKLRMGDLLPLLEPLLDSIVTRKIALKTLADSPSENDRLYVINLSKKTSKDPDILSSLKESRYIKVVERWLDVLKTNALPENYYFSVFQDSLLQSDLMHVAVIECIGGIKDPKVRASLIPALKGRKDSASQGLMLRLVQSNHISEREAASTALAGTCSDGLKLILVQHIGDTTFCTPNSFDLAQECGIDSLHVAAEAIYSSNLEYLTKISALRYLATYPMERYRDLFRTLLAGNPQDNQSSMRIAAIGLAQLDDMVSVEKIIKIAEQERKGSDWNASNYFEALAKLKCEASKTFISSFLNSKENSVRELAKKLIKNW